MLKGIRITSKPLHGYEIEKTWCNKDVQRYINDERQADKRMSGPNAYYIEFEVLANLYLKKDGKTCEELDREVVE